MRMEIAYPASRLYAHLMARDLGVTVTMTGGVLMVSGGAVGPARHH